MSILTRNKKVAAGVGVAAAAAAAIALGTGTYAAFTATAAGPGGTLAAGTMALQVNYGSDPTTLFDNASAPLYPGQSFKKDVVFKNVSPVDATLSGAETLTDGVDGGGDGNYLRYEMTQSSTCVFSANTATVNPALLKDVGNVVDPNFVIPANQTATCTFTFTLPNEADNRVQGDSIKVSSIFTLTQKI